MHPSALYMGFSVFSWSLYPLLIVFGTEKIGAITFVLVCQALAGVSALFMIPATLSGASRGPQIARLRGALGQLSLEGWGVVMGVGLSSALCHVCFVYALGLTSKIGASIIYETWPILAMFMTASIINKEWDSLRLFHYVTAFIALIGIGMITISDQAKFLEYILYPKDSFAGFDMMSVLGCIIAFIGAIMMAMSTLLRARISLYIGRKIIPDSAHSMAPHIVSEAVSRLATIPVLLFFFGVFPEENSFDAMNITAMVIMGVVLFNMGTAAHSKALIFARSPTINLWWFMMPVLAVLWLEMAGFSNITPLIAGGMMLILGANILLALDGLKKPANLAPQRRDTDEE